MTGKQHDAPDIPPALSAEEWAAFEATRRNGELEVSVAKYDDEPTALYVWDSQADPGAAAKIEDVNDIAATIALANEVLRRMDDPRAILREHIALLREVADAYEHDTAGLDDDRSARVHEFADALESYLPPSDERVDNPSPAH